MNKETKKGNCPKCDSQNINYGPLDISDDIVYNTIECNDCGHEDEEYYSLTFIIQQIKNKYT